MGVAIVTDSSAYLPPELITRHDLEVVPLQIVIGGASYEDGLVTTDDLAEAMREWQPVSTSRPSPERFAQAYKAAAGTGASAIVSVHLSGTMSGSLECAYLAAEEASVPVRVVDSRTIGMALGFAALSGALAAEQGAGLDEVEAVVRRRAENSSTLFYVDTLEYLRRGGRIGAAAGFLGTALRVKPLLHLSEGRIAPLEKVRTSSRALSRMEELVLARAGDAEVDIGVQHVAAAPRAEALANRLRDRVPNLRDLRVTEVGPVIGAHVGPGTLGVAISPL
ncbi:DegV family protein [Actinocorallia sp. B10E7]|uniref:DegV family protein n=1 Tax=Actinocorallia sp. B10E7 TaxID=3153558 RepID=UPI00325C86EE